MPGALARSDSRPLIPSLESPQPTGRPRAYTKTPQPLALGPSRFAGRSPISVPALPADLPYLSHRHECAIVLALEASQCAVLVPAVAAFSS